MNVSLDFETQLPSGNSNVLEDSDVAEVRYNEDFVSQAIQHAKDELERRQAMDLHDRESFMYKSLDETMRCSKQEMRDTMYVHEEQLTQARSDGRSRAKRVGDLIARTEKCIQAVELRLADELEQDRKFREEVHQFCIHHRTAMENFYTEVQALDSRTVDASSFMVCIYLY